MADAAVVPPATYQQLYGEGAAPGTRLVKITPKTPSPVVAPRIQRISLGPAPKSAPIQPRPRPPPVPSPFDYHLPLGYDREKLFQQPYHILYNPPGTVYDPRTGKGWCKLRNITRGRVVIQPHIEYTTTTNADVTFWPRDIRMRDPWERFLAVMRDLFSVKTLPQQFMEAMRPKEVSYDIIMKTDRFIPLRNAAPVWVDMCRLGMCVAVYAENIYCGVNLSVKMPVPFLVVKQLDPFDGASGINSEYRGNFWWVPMAVCLPLRCLPISWPNPNRGGDFQPDEVVMLWEDGFARMAPLQYVLQDRSREMVEARSALFAQHPETFGLINIPLVSHTPEEQARMARYSVVRYGPDNSSDNEDEAAEEEIADESPSPLPPAIPKATNLPQAAPAASNRVLPW